ncbi:hypothetical protein SUDANB126_02326 [Streptomyces sp. enrichment culture]
MTRAGASEARGTRSPHLDYGYGYGSESADSIASEIAQRPGDATGEQALRYRVTD